MTIEQYVEAGLTAVEIKGKHFLLSPIVAGEILNQRSQDEVHWKTRRMLLVEIKQLRKDLARYGQHSEKCSNHPRGECICGFSDALRREKT